MVFVLVSRSRRVVPDELVTLTSWDARDFLIFFGDGRVEGEGCCQGWSGGL